MSALGSLLSNSFMNFLFVDLLKELWTKDIPDEQTKSTYQYILELKERLEKKHARVLFNS